ncbi:MAG TPA: NADPH-dependent assimilatory sulfite reductase hemoprotein subunit [Candidatus Dormibacteraeota bacterium]|jgi:sulfite reductase (ferredoxin)|nr:NADPH-dependent assimilatory sulfite reductase hemoprotein subunit [Candidatus Dormibacteraeota bacterium]
MSDPDLRPRLEEQSKIESYKAASEHLRGPIVEELESSEPAFTDNAIQVLKFHGVYQQDDRDLRKQARARGLAKHWQMMMRTRIPGGKVSPEGYLAHDEIAERWGNATLRITTRQDFQLHGILKDNLRNSIRAINQAMMTTLGGCGDQVRNVMCCPAPVGDRLRDEIQEALWNIVGTVTPRTNAYHEIWVDGERVTDAPPGEEEDLYGDQYLPRKFKIAVAPEGDNCIDIYSNDLGLVAMRDDDGGLAGFNLLVGGGLGRTHHKPNTYPAVGRLLGFVPADRVEEVTRAVITVQRDNGDRANRRHARLKYLLADRGLDWFREQVQERLSFPLEEGRPLHWHGVDDHLGWHRQQDGRWFYGLFVENGRIKDEGEYRLRSAMRQIVTELRPTLWLTAQQNVLFADLEESAKPRLRRILALHGVPLTSSIPLAVRNSMACPAIPTCGLAVAESERVLPQVIRELAAVQEELGLARERISVRMTGCPNGCARPYLGDIGFVGTTLGKYDVYLGGDFEGTRLNIPYSHNVGQEELVPLLRPLLEAFVKERNRKEGFGDWCHRLGVAYLQHRFQVLATA